MESLCLKRGDTLYLVCSQKVRDVPIDLTGWEIHSEVRTNKYAMVHKFVPDVQAPLNNIFILTASPEETSTWPLGELLCDIRYKSPDGIVSTTTTFAIRIIREVTEWE